MSVNDDRPPKSPNINPDAKLIRDLNIKRGFIKARLTRLIKYVESLSLEKEVLSESKCIELKLRMQGASSLLEEFSGVQNQLDELLYETDFDKQVEARDDFESSYYSMRAAATCHLGIDQDTTGSSKSTNRSQQSIKLPTISLPSFDGSYEHWLEFRDTFISLVHDSRDISNIQKFHYLKSSLKGSAELVIKSLEFSSNNYPITWELLLNRYNNSSLLVHNHVKALFSIQTITKESSVLLRKLIDTVLKNIRSLTVLGEPTDFWDTLIIYMVVSKLDSTTEREWEQYKRTILLRNTDNSKLTLKVNDLLGFLRNRAEMLETLTRSTNTHDKKPNAHNLNAAKVHCHVANTNNDSTNTNKPFRKRSCLKCNTNHPLYSCQLFIDMPLPDKVKFVEDNKLCYNCMRAGHSATTCRFGPCRKCNKKHNSLLHSDASDDGCTLAFLSLNEEPGIVARPSTSLGVSMCDSIQKPRRDIDTVQVNNAHIDIQCAQSSVQPVLLSTALVEICDSLGKYHKARVLLDSGSQRCFITKSLCDRLNTQIIQSTHKIHGVGNSVTQSTQTCNVLIKSVTNTYATRIQCLVLPQITTLSAITTRDIHFSIPHNIQLADPSFHECHKVDILIGADMFWELLSEGRMKLADGPFLQNTKLGWIISGPILNNALNGSSNRVNCNFTNSIDTQLKQFWELEEMPALKPNDTFTTEERACENHFVQTTKRESDGRFCVQIPFKESPSLLGESYEQAKRRFISLEKRLERSPSYKQMYSDFIKEYESLGHMTRTDTYKPLNYFLPHHGVFREHSTTTKLRVVFDASAATTSNKSRKCKTLGLGWLHVSDELHFNTQFKHDWTKLTKRIILSSVSQIYDPLGLLSPSIMTVKVLLQKLWLLKLGWDDPVPEDVVCIWNRFASNLSVLSSLRVPRYVTCDDPIHTELHIFTDASQTAYGACAYIRTITADGNVCVRLLFAKGKVTPLKPVTIPRLELCGALLGAKLFHKIRESLRCRFDSIIFWTDSTIVLGWLRMAPNLLKTFVQNRVVEIHELTNDIPWRHVSGVENPADLVSRGLDLNALSTSQLWWEGPSFLHDPDFKDNQVHVHNTQDDLPEVKGTLTHCCVASTTELSLFPFARFSQFNRMKRACAYVLRFVYNSRNKTNKRVGSLSVDELKDSTNMLARLCQMESYPDEYNSVLTQKTLHKKHNLLKLNPFLDERKIIRVGGRLGNSQEFKYNKKHPVLLSVKHHFTVLLFRHMHKQLLHAAPQMLLFTIRDNWWPVGGRDLARKIVHECVTCTRLRAKTLSPIMGNLPEERLTPGFPFLRCGVDYFGPVLTLNRKGRGARTVKAYVAVFICFTTRAVHLELVCDLSTDAYLLTLKRFISRRGKPVEIFSDNGRNFVGLMNEFSKFISNCSKEISDYAIERNIKFTFIPPYAPHFGGLWEAGVKSCKYHLRRVVGNAYLTYEEFSTVLAQVEAILNSRPLSPMSHDPNDLQPLSPAHFLVGRPLTSSLSANLEETPVHRLTRYQRIEQIKQNFWRRWSKEYVSELQTRMKWRTQTQDLKEGTLVIIKDDNSPPLKWQLGRVTSNIPGRDGIARVACIQTSTGVIKRAYAKICPLPLTTADTS
ncbi:uncharacterized protein LOC126372431 [Pectinophora gossypiella]|uniref:uncharacterized protein LOC126372431 n=1 Tax=Pectinophora gossypiella TaxID=13191 RepID=UPI00214E0471|nr:uncharacterized protein LOC126372431 [Pectinophora gossypiella]